MDVRRGMVTEEVGRGDDTGESILSHGCGREVMPVAGGTACHHRAVAEALAQGRLPLTAVGCGLAALSNDTALPPRATVCEPSWLVSCAQGPTHRCGSHASAGKRKARMGTGNVRFFLRISPIFSICRMLISLVHFLCEAATRCIPHHRGHDLRASHALT